MADDVRRLSDELVRDPGSRVFVPLGEALRRQGQLDLALKVTLRGLERHPHFAEAHDLLARIAVDRGDLERAFDEWDMVLRLAPGHLGADRKSTRLNSSHANISYAVFCLKKKKKNKNYYYLKKKKKNKKKN